MKRQKLTETEWINMFSEYPILIEHSIAVKGNHAIIIRTPEMVMAFLK
jgi:hypothetical protein